MQSTEKKPEPQFNENKSRCKLLKKAVMQFTGQKNGGQLKRGGTLQCPPVRSGRPRTLRTVTG